VVKIYRFYFLFLPKLLVLQHASSKMPQTRQNQPLKAVMGGTLGNLLLFLAVLVIF
jgi:hypothetical protein